VKKILLIANTDWYLYRFRISLANFLRMQGDEVVFVSPSGRFVPDIKEQGFRWIEWYVGRQSVNPLIELKAILGLARIYSYERPSLVHLHTIKPVIYGSIAAQLTGVPAVIHSITGRGYVFLGKDIKARLLRAIVKRVYRFVLNSRCSMTIFENETDRDYFLDENLVMSKNSSVIEGVGVDTDYYSFSPESDGVPIIVLAGRMLWDKGVGTFVDAARLLHSKKFARFILVGEPDSGNPASIDISILDEWVNEGVVEWWGWQADIRSVFVSCHIVVLPSLGEGIPTILLEAAATGRPIVATDVPGCRDVVVDGSTGFLVPQQDPLALATALEKLIVNPKMRKTMGRAGREYIIQRFDGSKINQETYRIYQNFSKNVA
jgi:glycosyltransferase involved in cell wall biosynthesis